jgi:ankyrin repeat protein
MKTLILLMLMLVSCFSYANDVAIDALKSAAWNGDYKKVEKLLDKGVKLPEGYLKKLILDGKFKMSSFLMERGENIQVYQDDKHIFNDIFEIYFLSGSYNLTCTESMQALDFLNSKGIKISEARDKGDNPFTVLYAASRRAGKGCLKLNKFILDNGGAPMMTEMWKGNTPYYNALARGKYENAQLYIEYGLDPNSPVSTGNYKTPLVLAARYGNLKVAKLLLKKGAIDIQDAINVDKPNRHGKEVVEYLILEH